MSSAKRPQGFRRSAVSQLALLIFTIVVIGLVIANYPDPSVALTPPIKNRLFIQVKLISRGVDGQPDLVFLVQGVGITLDLVSSGRLRQALSTQTNSTGEVEVMVDSGYYRVTFADWWSGYLLINQPTTVNVTKYLFKVQPSSVDIFSISRNWTISQGDVIEASFTNTFNHPVRLESILIGNHTLSAEGQNIPPMVEWRDRYVVPAGVSTPWSTARRYMDLAFQVTYTEVEVNP